MDPNRGSIGDIRGFIVIRSSLLPKGTVLAVDPEFYAEVLYGGLIPADEWKRKACIVKTEELDRWNPEPKKS